MPKTIVTGYDGSSGGREALAEALRLARETDARVIALYIYEKVVVGGESHDLDEAVESLGEEMLAEAGAEAEGSGVQLTTEYIEGPAAETLAAVAEREQASYIVVGGNGERPLKAWALGTTANKLLALASCPVVVVRAD